ncbi:MAG: succinate--CoA ligase subunit alpha, partial [Actinomycetota bacterium]|nr:succinate--CoA ligase subunit alpha [Actinomycetota bacterium]
MAIFLDSESRVVVQGMTGSEGRKHTQRMLNSGTRIVGGVNPNKAGQSVEFELGPGAGVPRTPGAGVPRTPGAGAVPVFGSVAEAMAETG